MILNDHELSAKLLALHAVVAYLLSRETTGGRSLMLVQHEVGLALRARIQNAPGAEGAKAQIEQAVMREFDTIFAAASQVKPPS